MNKRGQIVVEYVLLLVIAAMVAALLVTTLISRNPDRPGILASKWHQILEVIGTDIPDEKP